MDDQTTAPVGFTLSYDSERLDLDRISQWLSVESYWAAGRERDVIERSFAGSEAAGVYQASSGRQVAVARVVTDGATFAWICDVFVDAEFRGLGLGSWLMSELVEHLMAERGILRLLLATRDAHAVYARAGFAPIEGPQRWMEIDHRPTRQAILAALGDV